MEEIEKMSAELTKTSVKQGVSRRVKNGEVCEASGAGAVGGGPLNPLERPGRH